MSGGATTLPLQGAKPACAAIPSHGVAQMHRTVDKLIARLNDRKMAALNVADAYRKNAEDSIAQVKQHCLQEGKTPTLEPRRRGRKARPARQSKLADRFRSDSGLFGKQLRAATAATKARSSARGNLTVDLDNAVQVQRQGYGRAPHSLSGRATSPSPEQHNRQISHQCHRNKSPVRKLPHQLIRVDCCGVVKVSGPGVTIGWDTREEEKRLERDLWVFICTHDV
ncbi:hypothetical protein V8C42DRAFT_274874 [Trichoderma barbatum]